MSQRSKNPNFICAGDGAELPVVGEAQRFLDIFPEAWPQDWEMGGTVVKKVTGPKTHEFQDIFVICSSSFLTFC